MWQEKEEKKPIADKSDMAELSFSVDCKELPYDHAYELSSEILNLVPEIKKDKRNAIQTLHGPMSGNGWVRPDSENIPLSKRAKLIMRINKNQLNDIKKPYLELFASLNEKFNSKAWWSSQISSRSSTATKLQLNIVNLSLFLFAIPKYSHSILWFGR